MEMKKKILKILSEIRPEIDFETESNFIEEDMLDSLDVIRLVSELDEKFNLSIDGSDIIPENFKGLNEIETLVKNYGGGI
jgi:acyl carrier protein